MLPEARRQAASDAWAEGLRATDPTNTRRWLDRALRLAPGDPRITLDLANASMAVGDFAAAAGLYAGLAERFDLATAWTGLLTAHRLGGDHAAAAQALGHLLARHCLPAEPQFHHVAGLVAGAAGWCGIAVDGTLVVQAAGRLGFALDGQRIARPLAAPRGSSLAVQAGKGHLLGSPLDLAALRRVQGVVEIGPKGLFGWASRPAHPTAAPVLTLVDADGHSEALRFTGIMPADQASPFQQRHEFSLSRTRLGRFRPPLRVLTADGADILGSPLASLPPPPWQPQLPPPGAVPAAAGLAIVMPVYRGEAVTRACLASLFAAAPAACEIIVIDDATPEPALAIFLDQLAAAGQITLLRHPSNRGFPAAANAGLQASRGRDVLLLNSDTLVPPGAIEMLLAVAYAAPANGSVTPLSNEATICSYPDPAGGNPAPDLATTRRLNALAAATNGQAAVPIPTGVGFCMLLRHDCLAATGLFDAAVFAQGYGEENDWCRRAARLGYRHLAAAGVFVAHLGGVSFQAAGQALNRRNAARLNRLHPGYDRLVGKFIAADPLGKFRHRLDTARFNAAAGTGGAVLIISHDYGGGVARVVAARMEAIRAAGQRPLLLFPATPDDPVNTNFPWPAQLTDAAAADYPNLRFTLPAQLPDLLALLGSAGIIHVELHHALGHHPLVRGLAACLSVPQDIVIHDYASFCPRVNLLTRGSPGTPLRYCGEPNLAGCNACIAANGDETFEDLPVAAVIARSAREFAAARQITAPSADAAQRIARHFPGIRPDITPWEDDAAPQPVLRPPRAGRRRIAVIGGIGPAKGFDLLIDCAMDAAARRLPLDFIVAGSSAEDAKLLQAGIFVTGAYQESEATALIAGLDADLALLPSIWPETWCFTLTAAWAAGLFAVTFDLGAQSERLRATGRGLRLPLGLPAGRINDALLAWRPPSA